MAKFASGGKTTGKKDLALMAMAYGHVYVAQVAMGGSDVQTLRAFGEAEAYDGPRAVTRSWRGTGAPRGDSTPAIGAPGPS